MAPQKQSSGSSPAVSEVSQDSAGPYGSGLAQKWGIGELVLAKLQGFPPWPARISEPEESHGSSSTSKTFIYLFGLGERRFCNSTEISSFSANAKAEFQKLQSEDFPSIYVQAVREICSADDELKLAAESPGRSQGQGLVESAVDVKEQDSILDSSSPHAIGKDIIVDSSQAEKFEHVESVQALDVGDVLDHLPDEVNCRVATTPEGSVLTFHRNMKTHSEEGSNLCSPCSLRENAQDGNENGDVASLGFIRGKGQPIVDKKLETQKQAAQPESVMEILASNTASEFTEGHIATTKLEEDLVKEASCLASSTTNVQPSKGMSLSGHSGTSNLVQERPTTKLESKEDSSPCTTHESVKRKEAPRLVYSRRKPRRPQQDVDLPRLEDLNAMSNTKKLDEHNLTDKSKMLISNDPSTSKAIEQGADDLKHKRTAPSKVKKRLMKHGRVVDSENNSNLLDAVKSRKDTLEDSLHDNGTADVEAGEAALPPSKRRKRVLEAMTAYVEDASKVKVAGSPDADRSSVHGEVEVRMLEKRSRKRKPSIVGDEKLDNVHEHSTEDGEEKPASRHPHEAGTLQKGESPNNAAQHKHHKKTETKITLKIKQNVKIGSNDIVNSHAALATISPGPDRLEMNGELKGNSVPKDAKDGKEEIKSLIAKAQEVRRLRLTTAPLVSNVDAQKSSPLAQGNKEALLLVSPVLRPKSADRGFANQIQPPELSTGIHPPDEIVEVNNGVHNVSINTHSIVVDEMEAGVSLQALEGMLETLSRTKDSINRATRLAMECARYGVADQVVMKILEKIESESSFHKKVDLFFLVDSITQCSNAKGVASIYPRAVEAVLPQLLRATAPFRTAARENRRQCLKVLKLWLERNILPASVLRRHIDELDAQPGSTFDDPLQGMEGINEYGSNAGLGLNLQDICPDEDLQQVPSHINMESCDQQAALGEYLLSPQAFTSSNDASERQKCLLENGGVDMEMEDVYHASNVGSTQRVGLNCLETSMEASIPLPLSPPPSPPPLPASPPPSPPPPPSQPPPPPPPPPPFYNQASNFATGRPPASAQYPVDMRYKRNQMEGSHYKWGSQEYHGRPAAGPQHFDKHAGPQHFDKHMPRVNGADTPNSYPPPSSHFHRRPMPFGPQYQSSGGSRMLSHPQSNNPVKHWQRHDNKRYMRRQHM